MYRPRHYDIEDPETLATFMREQSFALLVTTVNGAPFATHLPLLLDSHSGGEHGRLLGHVAKGNPHWQSFDGETEALAVFSGPHAYISPTWYASENVVPTWNYVTVHAYGRPVVIDDPEKVREGQARLVEAYESDATGNWSLDDMSDDYASTMLKAIVSFEMPIDRVEGKFKLNQKKSAADLEAAVKGLRETGDEEAIEVARLMAEYYPAD
ncbi:MAG: FMN-binding negative transcriptional regulator [Rhodospirillales bacterium]